MYKSKFIHLNREKTILNVLISKFIHSNRDQIRWDVYMRKFIDLNRDQTWLNLAPYWHVLSAFFFFFFFVFIFYFSFFIFQLWIFHRIATGKRTPSVCFRFKRRYSTLSLFTLTWYHHYVGGILLYLFPFTSQMLENLFEVPITRPLDERLKQDNNGSVSPLCLRV